MSEYVIVRINDKLIPEFQILFNASDDTAIKAKISSWEDIKLEKQQKLILVLSGNLVLTTQVNIPSKNDEVIRQSIPFALEEEIATDVDDNHFSFRHLTDQNFLVSVVNKNTINRLQNKLTGAGLLCNQLYSEIFTVPFVKSQLTICQIDDYYIVRDGLLGTTVKKPMLATYRQVSNQTKVVCYTNESKSVLSADKTFEVKNINIEHFQAKSIISNNSVNLFQGEYTQKVDKKRSVNPWKKIITLTAVLIVSWLGIHLFQIWKLSSDIATIKSNQKALILEVIPNASQVEIKDPYSAFQSRLKLLQNSQLSSNNQGFIIALSYLGKSLIQHKSIQVQSLRLRNAKLEIKLLAQDVNQLNQFQLSLKNRALSMRVLTGTRDTNSDGVSSIITMEQL